jgi:hypothetical protein
MGGNDRDQEAHYLGRVSGGCEPAALDRREMLANHAHLADVGTASEERLVDRLLVLERKALGG